MSAKPSSAGFARIGLIVLPALTAIAQEALEEFQVNCRSCDTVDRAALLQLVTSATVCAQFGTPLVQHGGSPNSVSVNRIDPAVKSYGAENTEVLSLARLLFSRLCD